MNKLKERAHTAEDILTYFLDKNVAIQDEVESFIEKLDVPELLEKWGLSKRSGLPALDTLTDILYQRLENISVENNLNVGKVPTDLSKDCYYRFLQRPNSDWLRLITELALRIIQKLIPDYSQNPEITGIFLYDDTPYRRPYSKNSEMLSLQFDHANKDFFIGGRLGMLDYVVDGKEAPVNYALVTSTDSQKYMAPMKEVEENTPAQERREIASGTLIEAMIKQILIALEIGFKAAYIAFDSWFTTPNTVEAVLDLDLDVIGRIKASPKIKFWYEDEYLDVNEIYERNRFTLPDEDDEDLLFSVYARMQTKNGKRPVKIVFCRAYGDCKSEFVAILCTDIELSNLTILMLYRLRWKEECINAEIKSDALRLSKNDQCLNLDSIWANIGIVLMLWLFAFYFQNLSQSGDSIQRSILRCSVHTRNVRVVNSLLLSLNTISETLQRDYHLDRRRVDKTLIQATADSGGFSFYFRNLPLDMF